MKQARRAKVKVGDRVKCTCCDEVHGIVLEILVNEPGIGRNPYNGYRVKNDKDVCGGGIVVVETNKAVKI